MRVKGHKGLGFRVTCYRLSRVQAKGPRIQDLGFRN